MKFLIVAQLEDVRQFYRDHKGLPAIGKNFRKRTTLYMAKKEVRVENINELCLPSST